MARFDRRRQSFFMLAAALASLTFAGTVAKGIVWTGGYDPVLGTLPQAQGWSFVDSNQSGQPTPVVAGGVLHQGPTIFSAYQYWTRTDVVSDFNTSTGLTVEAKVRIVSSTYGSGGFGNDWRTGDIFSFGDANAREATFGISDTGVRLSTGSDLENSLSSAFVPFNTTSDVNTYLLTANISGVDLSIDGNLVTSLPLGVPTNNVLNNPGSANYWYFGDGTSSGNSETYLSSLKYSVPEPTSLSMLFIGASLLILRRRCKSIRYVRQEGVFTHPAD